MLQSVSGLFKRPGQVELDETDLKKFVERYLRQCLNEGSVYCEGVKKGSVKVRVGTALLAQEVQLCQYELGEALTEEAGISLKRLTIIQS